MDELADYERRFRRAGLPLFIEDYSASEDIFNRSVPLLGLIFIGEVLLAVDEDWSLLANLGAIAGGLAILLLAVGIVNRLDRRPFVGRPERVGRVELIAFVVVPALLPVIFGQQLRQAALIAVANALVLLLVYLVVGYALIATVRWAGVRVLGELAKSVAILARAVPLLLVFTLLLMMGQETWQVFGSLSTPFLLLACCLFLGLGALFMIARLPHEVRDLERAAGGDGPPLRRRQRLNVGVVLFVSQSLQMLIVSAAVGLFFVVFGMIAFHEPLQRTFVGDESLDVLLRFELFGGDVALSRELLRLAAGLAAFSGLYYAIAVLNDRTYREEFLEDLSEDMRETFRQRAEYLSRRAATATG